MFCFFNQRWPANASIRRSLLLSLMQNRFLNTISETVSAASSSSSFTVEYLTKSCVLPLQSALSSSQNFQLHESNLPNSKSVLEFLKSHDFDNTQIAKFIEKQPQVLLCGVEDNLKPKFEFLIANGCGGQLLPRIIVSNPLILKTDLDSHIKPSFDLLKSIIGSNEKIVQAIRRTSWLLTYDLKGTVQPNIDFLIKEGMPVDNVTKMMVSWPRVIMRKHDRVVFAVNAVKNLGLDPKTPVFVHALRVMILMGESGWKQKIELMKTLGWSEEEILRAYKRYPLFLSSSEEKIRSGMDVLVNSMKLMPQTIIGNPKFLTYSIDKTLCPRYNVFRVLQSMKLIKGDKKIEFLLTLSEKEFLDKYVTKYVDKVPSLLEIYRGGADNTRKIDT